MNKRGRKRSKRQGPQVNPVFGYILFVGIGLGTWRIGIELRHLVSWMILLLAAMLYIAARPLKANYTLPNVGWGMLAGLLVGLPALIFGWRYLPNWPLSFFGSNHAVLIFYQVALVTSLVEELYFRGFVQREMGMWAAIAMYACYALIIFLPNEGLLLKQVLAITLGYGVLGFMQSYVYRRYGFCASATSRIMLNLLLFVIPAIVGAASAPIVA